MEMFHLTNQQQHHYQQDLFVINSCNEETVNGHMAIDDNSNLNEQLEDEDDLDDEEEGDEEETSTQRDDDQDDEKDPFSLKCRIPLPNAYGAPNGFDDGHPSGCYSNLFDSTTFIKRRNERERTRVRNVNDGFERLRSHLPLMPNQRDKRLSKVETLRMAISYIKHLQSLLDQC